MRFKLALKWLAIGLILGLSVDTLAQTNVANSAADLAGKILMVADSALGRTVTNLFTFDRGAAVPFAVGASSLKVTNLDADKLDGIDSTGFVTPTGSVTLTNKTLTSPTITSPVLSGTPTGSWTTPSFAGLTNTALTDLSGASAGQIKFPASQNASGNANTLDDYEKGTWTPVIGGASATSGQAYSVQSGSYTKIGRMVFMSFDVTLSTKGTITGAVQIQGFPYAASSSMSGGAFIPYFISLNTNWISLGGIVFGNNSAINLYGTQAAAATVSALAAGDISNTTEIAGGFVYVAAN